MNALWLEIGGLYRFVRDEPANLFNLPGRSLYCRDVICVVGMEQSPEMIHYDIIGAGNAQSGKISLLEDSALGFSDFYADMFEKIV